MFCLLSHCSLFQHITVIRMELVWVDSAYYCPKYSNPFGIANVVARYFQRRLLYVPTILVPSRLQRASKMVSPQEHSQTASEIIPISKHSGFFICWQHQPLTFYLQLSNDSFQNNISHILLLQGREFSGNRKVKQHLFSCPHYSCASVGLPGMLLGLEWGRLPRTPV